MLLFWVFARNKRSENELNLKNTELTVNMIKLRQENNELKTANEKLQQENAELSREKIEALESRVNTETATK
jgi:cell division protein FtsB